MERAQVLKALEAVIDPELRRSVVELDMIRELEISGDEVSLVIALTVQGCPLRHSFEEQVASALAGAGVVAVTLSFTVMTPEERLRLRERLHGTVEERSRGIQLDVGTRVLVLASGKGGVGKSTLTANLAYAFMESGLTVGILDADVYGHSIPQLLGVKQRPIMVDQLIVPPVKDGLKLMSIGFFLDENKPIMWRGPMLHRALEQFLTEVYWGPLDLLLVDMPPGTGDVAISLGQLLPRAEVLVVTTPPQAAQEVAARTALMAQRTGQQLLGVVENMTSEIFGRGGGQELAERLGLDLLGSVPLDYRLREQGDLGSPLVATEPEAAGAQAIHALASVVLARKPSLRALPLLS
jgi:ATP-binding protein involved in chromosome partitioning